MANGSRKRKSQGSMSSKYYSLYEKKVEENSASTWRRYGDGYRIQDLNEEYYGKALKLLEECYMNNDYVCKSMNLNSDKLSMQCFLERVLFHIRNKNSLIIVDERIKCSTDENEMPIYKIEDEIAGVLVSRIINVLNYGHVLSRTTLMSGEAQKQFVEFKHDVCRNFDLFEIFNCNLIMNIYYVCIKTKFRRRGFALHLMNAALDMARTLNVPAITGLFGNGKLQTIAKFIGMTTLNEINYDEWNNRNTQIFENRHETKCALMGCFVEKESPVQAMIEVEESSEKDKKSKKNKKDKKKKDKKKQR